MPALPHLYGVLSIPSGAAAIMSDKAGGVQTKVHVGDTIGEFKIAKLDTQHITLQWKDKTVEKSVDELLDRTPVPTAPEPARAAAAAAPAPTGPPVPPQFGIEIGDPSRSIRACKGDDTSPAGTVLEGYTKHEEATPFGKACRWLQDK
jgi:hypothetical protein